MYGSVWAMKRKQNQIQKDDEILSKPKESLTNSEKKRLKKIEEAQTQKRSLYEKRAMKHLANEQPKTYDEYERRFHCGIQPEPRKGGGPVEACIDENKRYR